MSLDNAKKSIIILGVLTASIPTILAFWFGSSFGSREKTAALAASSPAQGAKGE